VEDFIGDCGYTDPCFSLRADNIIDFEIIENFYLTYDLNEKSVIVRNSTVI